MTSFAMLVNVAQELSPFLVFQYGVGSHFGKGYFTISRYFVELHGAYLSSHRLILPNQSRNLKMVTDRRKITLLRGVINNI